MKRKLLGLTSDEMKNIALELGLPKFAGTQMAEWIYHKHVGDISEMTNISKANREKLAESFEVGCAAPIDAQHSKDGTIKYLFPVSTTSEGNTGKFVETVFIPEENNRATLCVSSQVGCKMNCLF